MKYCENSSIYMYLVGLLYTTCNNIGILFNVVTIYHINNSKLSDIILYLIYLYGLQKKIEIEKVIFSS